MKFLFASCLAVIFSLSVSARDIKVSFEDDKSAVVNPGMGFCHYAYAGRLWAYGSSNPAWDTLDWFPGCSTVYMRVLWSDLEPEEGKYRWDLLDRYQQPWCAAGKKIAIRVICCNQTKEACPDFVREAGAKGRWFRYKKHNVSADFPLRWEPEYDDPIFLEKFGDFLRAFAARYDGSKDVAFVDVGSFGLYGEGHSEYLSNLFITAPSEYNRLAQLHLKMWREAMPNTYLVVSDDIGGSDNSEADHPNMAYARSLGIGFRDDSIFCSPKQYWYHSHWGKLAAEQFPVVIETGHISAFDAKGYSDQALTEENFLKCIEDHRASYFSIHEFPEDHLERFRTIIEKMNLRLGYRIVPEEIIYPETVTPDSPVTIRSRWHNAGVAPCYGGGFLNWMLLDRSGRVCWSSVDASFNVKSLEPTVGGRIKPMTVESRVTFGHTEKNPELDNCLAWARATGRDPGDWNVMLPAGEYELCFSIGDKMGKPEIAVPVAGDRARRIHTVGRITVLPANGSPAPFRQTVQAPVGDIRSVYLEFGTNMWCEWPSIQMGQTFEEAVEKIIPRRRPALKVIRDDSVWQRVTEYASRKGINMLVLDLGEALIYPSHPELAVEGSWNTERMRDEIRRLNNLGIEVVPKLNFSQTHNGWMKEYRRMICTPEYYKVCEDLIADVMDIFGNPRYFHIGFDEESIGNQKQFMYKCCRTGELWWNDLLFFVRTVENHGARVWMWSDYGWNHSDFYERCPKSVIQQNWYYDDWCEGFDAIREDAKGYNRVKGFIELEKHGFDQVPCGTNWVSRTRAEKGAGADDIMDGVVDIARKRISKEHLYGYMIAVWDNVTPENEESIIHGIDLLDDALKVKTIL